MKAIALVLLMTAAGLAGCAVGPLNLPVVIETGEARLGDGDYARAMALRSQAYRARTSAAETPSEDSRR